MTPRTWAAKKVEKAWQKHRGGLLDFTSGLVVSEHARAVRVVKQEIVATEKLRDTALRVDNVAAEAVYLDTIVALNKALAALQKGRT